MAPAGCVQLSVPVVVMLVLPLAGAERLGVPGGPSACAGATPTSVVSTTAVSAPASRLRARSRRGRVGRIRHLAGQHGEAMREGGVDAGLVAGRGAGSGAGRG